MAVGTALAGGKGRKVPPEEGAAGEAPRTEEGVALVGAQGAMGAEVLEEVAEPLETVASVKILERTVGATDLEY